ncbi:BatD family protein [Pajaroellobacter abortibovis]|uniref:BatD family protein n=1 Tax=Pajaroellobacter abortibovis TaxID=1882918 RepID=UPI00155F91C1|nr:BatD family protein [Pajaroellobacter abortibovis]
MVLFHESFAWTQQVGSEVELLLHAESEVVGVDDSFELVLSASSSAGSITNPTFNPGSYFHLLGTRTSPTQSISIMNGNLQRSHGLTVVFSLSPKKIGEYVLGPAAVVMGGKRWESNQVRIRVVASAQPPRARSGRGFPFPSLFSFGPWKGLFGDLGADEETEPLPFQSLPILADEHLTLSAPRGEIAFLHGVLDKSSAVVGEQVTLSLYLYIEGHRGSLDITDVHESDASDFLKHSLLSEDSASKPIGYVNIEGKIWSVSCIRKLALFPLKTGELEIKPMSISLGRRSIAANVRQSEFFHIPIGEPPMLGRPAGYRVGDVGDFQLSVQVSPPEVEEGGGVSVQLELSGTGNIPSMLSLPVQPRVEWLDPIVHEKLAVDQAGKWGGARSFQYIARVRAPGDLSLGEISLPYWNPETKAYGIARAALGKVYVKGSLKKKAASSSDQENYLMQLPVVWKELVGVQGKGLLIADSPLWGVGLVAPPLTYLLVEGVWLCVCRYRKRQLAYASSSLAELDRQRAKVESLLKAGDAVQADAAMGRALEMALCHYLDCNLRLLPWTAMGSAFEKNQLPLAMVQDCQNILQASEVARFGHPVVSLPEVEKRWKRTQEVIDSMKRRAA